MTKGDKELALVFGGAGALLLVYLFWPKTTAAATAAAASTQNAVAMQPGATTIAPALGSQVVFTLPAGSSWQGLQEVDTAGNAQGVLQPLTGSAPYSFAANDDGGIAMYWTDAAGSTQTTMVFVVPPGS